MSATVPHKRRNRRNSFKSHELTYWLERVDGRFMGAPVDVDPHEALLHAIRVTAGEVVYCDQQISRLQENELFERPLHTSTTVEFGKLTLVEESRDPEVLSRWVMLRDSALERMAKFSKMALDSGVAERQVAAAERVAGVLEPLLRNLAKDLELSPSQEKLLPAVISRTLRQLESTQGDTQ